MSFAGTPLGQGRRLDHNAFHGKPISSSGSQSQNYIKPPSSYSYGAPALGSRSPPKLTSPSRSWVQPHEEEEGDNSDERIENGNEGALSRFARLKQQQQAIATTNPTTTGTTTSKDFSNRPGGPKFITSPPKPEKWSVKDTSVNIATAFTQAASSSFGDMNTASSTYNHNHNWASTSRNPLPVPRSTSVEYEAATTAAAAGQQGPAKRLPLPPDKFTRSSGANATAGRKPLSKTASIRHVPDSEGEEDQTSITTTTNHNPRGKSPFENGLSYARHALGAAAYYVRHRSREPEERSVNGNNAGDESYDYAAEEQAYQSQKRSAASTTTPISGAATRRNRMSIDNKAYKPSQESEDDDDEAEWSDDGKTKRRRRRKGPVGGPLSTLPVVRADKRRKRKKGTLGGAGEDVDGESGSDEADNSQTNLYTTPSDGLPYRRSQDPQIQDDSMISAEQGLTSIPEVEEEHILSSSISATHQQQQQQQRRSGSTRPRSRSRSRTPAPHHISSFSIGGFLGHIVHFSFQLLLWISSSIVSCLSMVTFLIGQVFGTIFDLILRRPVGWAASGLIGRYAFPALALVLAWYVVREASLGEYMQIPGLSTLSRRPYSHYNPPDAPAADISELAERLLKIENALSGLSVDAERFRTKSEDGIRSYQELQSRLGTLEGKIWSDIRRVQDVAEARAREVIRGEVGSVRRDVEVLSAKVGAEKSERERARDEKAMDEEARKRLKLIEERIGGVEGGVRDALEQLAKKAAVTTPPASPPPSSSAWWSKLASGVGVIKSADGQDVTSLISELVHSAMSIYTKDYLAKPDFALHSAGGRIIPSLTSRTLELSPRTLWGKMTSLVTGTGYAIGRSPVTALHHEMHNGHCWPFAGDQGQLGVVLARATVAIEEVTIDHVSRDVALDIGSAPKDMEIWGMVEGKENIEKLNVWREREAAARKEAEEQGFVYDGADDSMSPSPYPSTLPKSPEFIRLANFTYDINAPNYVQTFPVDIRVRELGLDFGIVVLRVLSNWGLDYTCLYRFRVHGRRIAGTEMPSGGIVVGDDQDGSEVS